MIFEYVNVALSALSGIGIGYLLLSRKFAIGYPVFFRRVLVGFMLYAITGGSVSCIHFWGFIWYTHSAHFSSRSVVTPSSRPSSTHRTISGRSKETRLGLVP